MTKDGITPEERGACSEKDAGGFDHAAAIELVELFFGRAVRFGNSYVDLERLCTVAS